jgi:hypothetical protein
MYYITNAQETMTVPNQLCNLSNAKPEHVELPLCAHYFTSNVTRYLVITNGPDVGECVITICNVADKRTARAIADDFGAKPHNF